MKVSIVIPAYDHQDLLDRSLATLAIQRKEFFECIVVDDGSKKRLETPRWVTNYRVERDHVHRGSSVAKNLGATVAFGDVLCFADSDILHMPDAILSLKRKMDEWAKEKEPHVLLNVQRVGLPRGYPSRRHMERLYQACMAAEMIPARKGGPGCFEQNCGMIRREFFNAIGGYDEAAFKEWGFNNQDLTLRVVKAGGRFSSDITRTDGSLLACFHIWHRATRNAKTAEKEFTDKWGKRFHKSMVDELRA